ncbi:hypothetical protein CPB86DRAFT_173379 [Serendipita vermifera]|nr:hypothetical protein CPB86DRAFT_173379 [Serendipita vermifera]
MIKSPGTTRFLETCDDILLEVFLLLEINDLLTLSLTCKRLHYLLHHSGSYKHWMQKLPPAFIPVQADENTQFDAEAVRIGLQRFRKLQSSWGKLSEVPSMKMGAVRLNSWNFHVPRTRWMFNFGTPRSGVATLQCFDLANGEMVGEYDIGERRPSPRLLSGEVSDSGPVTISFAHESREDEKLVWKVVIVHVRFTRLNASTTEAQFSLHKSITLLSNLTQKCSNFNYLQLEGDYIAMSGSWSSRRFLLINWRKEQMTELVCPKLWRTFDWKLINSAILVAYDDGEICWIDVPSRFTVTNPAHIQGALSLLQMDKWKEIRFDRHDQTTVALTINSFSNSILHSLVSVTEGDSFSSDSGTFDNASLQDLPINLLGASPVRCFGNMWVALEGSKTMSFWTAQNQLWKKYKNDLELERPVSQVLSIDEEIGMIVVRDWEENTAQNIPSSVPICVYWVG